jgi:hypothetical protein
MGKQLLFATVLVLAAAPAFAQEEEGLHHHDLALGFGAAIPAGNSTNYLGTAPLLAFRYGYRLNHYLQADVGFQTAWGAANNHNAVVTDVGAVQGGDHEFMIPLGGRVIVPQPFKRFEMSAGGGAAYLHYSETAPSGGYYQLNCYSCTSRGGWGGYGLASVAYFLDQSRNFHLGTTFQYISATTTGQDVGNVAGISTSDHWANLTFEVGLRF